MVYNPEVREAAEEFRDRTYVERLRAGFHERYNRSWVNSARVKATSTTPIHKVVGHA